MRDSIFISYCHKDRKWLERLRTMLRPLEMGGSLDLWDESRLQPGGHPHEEIEAALGAARVAILLVSPDYLASPLIAGRELPRLLEAANQKGLVILWVLIRSCLWERSPLSQFVPAHDVKRPLSRLRPNEQDDALLGITLRVEQACAQTRPNASVAIPKANTTELSQIPKPDPASHIKGAPGAEHGWETGQAGLITVLGHGVMAGIEGIGLRVQPMRQKRNSSPAVPFEDRALEPGDQLQIQFRSTGTGWLYLLIQRGTDLSLPWGEQHVAAPGQSNSGARLFDLDRRVCRERPVMLYSSRQVQGLTRLIQTANRHHGDSPDGRLSTLHRLLAEQSLDESFALVFSDSFQHASVREHLASPGLLAALAAIERDDYAGAEQQLNRLLAAQLSVEQRGRALVALGLTLRRRGAPDQAIEVLRRARECAMAVQDLDVVADAWRETARAWLDSGDLEKSHHFLGKAIRGHRQTGNRLEEARDHLHLAALKTAQGHLEAAFKVYRRTLRMAKEAGARRVLAAALQGLGQVCHDLGRFEQATRWQKRALSTFIEEDDLRGQMRSHGDLGLLAMERGDLLAASLHFRMQLCHALEVGTPQLVALSRLNLGLALQKRGLHADARNELLDALANLPEKPPGYRIRACFALGEISLSQHAMEEAHRWVRLIGEDSPDDPLEARWRRALLRARYLQATDHVDAKREFEAGIRMVEQERETLTRRFRTHFLEGSAPLFEAWISYLVRREAPPAEVLEAIERSRARALLDALAGGGGPARSAALCAPRPPRDIRAFAPLSLREIQQTLPVDHAFLAPYILPDRFLIFGVTQDRVIQRTVPLTALQLEMLCREVKLSCAAQGHGVGEPGLPHAWTTLSDLLLGPVQDWLSELSAATVLGFIPHGPFQGVPVHALPSAAEQGRPLVSGRAVFYAPSLQAAALCFARPRCASSGVLALANPTGDLAHAEEEAKHLLARLDGRESATPQILCLKSEATIHALKEYGPAARYIHLATHGYGSTLGREAALQLAPSRPRPSDRAQQPDPAISLAATAKGLLTRSQIAQLQLDARLVMISACQSGTGELTRMGEVHSQLAAAFLTAGARAVVGSGWNVHDMATARLVRSFYQYISSGAPLALALARAQRELMYGNPEFASPYYWGAFFLTGDPR